MLYLPLVPHTPLERWLDRRWVPCAALLLALLACLQVTSVVGEAQTWDEAIHLGAGYSYWRTGDFRLNLEHPPLGKLLSALPLLALPIDDKLEHKAWKQGQQIEYGNALLYENTSHADLLLFLGRLPTILLTVLFGASLCWFTRREFGSAIALLALFFFCLDPNILAHGRYVTTDLIGAMFFFLATAAWYRWLVRPSGWALLGAGLLFGVALISKFSCVLLLLTHTALYAVRWWQVGEPSRYSVFHAARSLGALSLCGAAVVLLCYAPESRLLFQKRNDPNEHTSPFLRGKRIHEVTNRNTTISRVLWWAGRRQEVPALSFLAGLASVDAHVNEGQTSYLLGRISPVGWPSYFPVAFAVKTPIVLLLGCAALLLSLVALLIQQRLGFVDALRQSPFLWWALSVPPLLYFLISLGSKLNIGLRHLLPVYPFLFVLVAAVAWRWASQRTWRMGVLAGLLALQAAEVAAAHPYYLAFFNWPSGGPENGSHYLVDSNLDWGQDLKRLRAYVDRERVQRLCIMYFGNAHPGYYGIQAQELPRTQDTEGRRNLDCIGAISATVLQDAYAQPGDFAWLRERKPIGNIGHSIVLYDLRKNAQQGTAR